ncbi:MAG TPA: hypothetical protein VM884_10715 [Flavisolibacter sp.]|jgi:hypothetical protein|nr:hypothetical protein [Flavisolibacter sp.]
MMTEIALSEFVIRKIKSGHPPGELKIDLMDLGYSEKVIDVAIASQAVGAKPNLFRLSGWIISGMLFLIIGLQQISSGNKLGYVLVAWGATSTALKFFLPFQKGKSLL